MIHTLYNKNEIYLEGESIPPARGTKALASNSAYAVIAWEVGGISGTPLHKRASCHAGSLMRANSIASFYGEYAAVKNCFV